MSRRKCSVSRPPAQATPPQGRRRRRTPAAGRRPRCPSAASRWPCAPPRACARWLTRPGGPRPPPACLGAGARRSARARPRAPAPPRGCRRPAGGTRFPAAPRPPPHQTWHQAMVESDCSCAFESGSRSSAPSSQARQLSVRVQNMPQHIHNHRSRPFCEPDTAGFQLMTPKPPKAARACSERESKHRCKRKAGNREYKIGRTAAAI